MLARLREFETVMQTQDAVEGLYNFQGISNLLSSLDHDCFYDLFLKGTCESKTTQMSHVFIHSSKHTYQLMNYTCMYMRMHSKHFKKYKYFI